MLTDSHKNLRVLVADDANNMRRTIKSMLRRIGFSDIVDARDGEGAWHHLNSSKIGFIICDWHMPKLPGLELLRRVRDNPLLRDIPFLMVTAEVSETRIVQAAETDVDGYLLKPFIARVLEEKIGQIMHVKENPSPFETHMKAGLTMMENGMSELAFEEFSKALEIKPDSARARQSIGEVFMRSGDMEKAEQWLMEAVRSNPQYVRAHESLGELYTKEKKDEKAINCYEQASAISPHNAERQLALGKLYISTNSVEKADKAFARALENERLDADLHTQIGEIYLTAGNPSKAAAAFKSSLGIFENVHVYNRLGIALRKKKRFKEAVNEYRKALKIDPADEVLYYNIGRAYFEMKDFDKAVSSLKKALDLDPDFSECHELLANAQEKLDKKLSGT